MQAESEGTDTCGEIADSNVRSACFRVLGRAHLRVKTDVGEGRLGRENVVPECESSTGTARDICVLSRVKTVGSAGEPKTCKAILNPLLRRECVTFWAASGWAEGLEQIIGVCELLSGSGRDECLFEVAENLAETRFGLALDLCWHAETTRPMCARHTVRIAVSRTLSDQHAQSFEVFVHQVAELQPALEKREWPIGGAGLVHSLWSDAFQLLAAHAVLGGEVASWMGLEKAFVPEDGRRALWRDVLAVAGLRNALSSAKTPDGGWSLETIRGHWPATSGALRRVADAPLVAGADLLTGSPLPAPWDVKPKGRRLSLMPYWAQPVALSLGSSCELSDADRQAVQVAWTVADLPVGELTPMLSELLGSASPVVRGAGLAVLGRARAQGQDPRPISDLLASHRSGEPVEVLRELSSAIETTDAMVGIQRLEAVVLALCP